MKMIGQVYIGAGNSTSDQGMCRVARAPDADGVAGPGTQAYVVDTMIGPIAVMISDVLYAADMERIAGKRIHGEEGDSSVN